MRSPATGFDLGTQFFQTLYPAGCQHDLRACFCQNFRESCTQTTGSARDQCDFAIEVNFYSHLVPRISDYFQITKTVMIT